MLTPASKADAGVNKLSPKQWQMTDTIFPFFLQKPRNDPWSGLYLRLYRPFQIREGDSFDAVESEPIYMNI